MSGKWLCAVAIAFLAAAGTVPADGQDDLKKLEGTWRFVSHEMQGKAATPEQLEKMSITFAGDKFAVSVDGKVVQAGMNKLDPAKKPAQVDAAVTEGQGKDTTMLGIYELKEDTMKVCFDLQGKERPTSFTAKASQMSAVIKREKK